jgi:hypothetical protein
MYSVVFSANRCSQGTSLHHLWLSTQWAAPQLSYLLRLSLPVIPCPSSSPPNFTDACKIGRPVRALPQLSWYRTFPGYGDARF